MRALADQNLLMDDRTGQVDGVDIRALDRMPYWLLTNPPDNIVTVGANLSSPPTILSVSNDGPAEIFKLSAQRTGVCQVMLQMQDGQETRSLMNGAIHIDNIFGTGAQPYRLPETLYIDELRHLVAIISDFSGAQNNVRLAALGRRYTTQQYSDARLTQIKKRLAYRQYVSWPSWYTLDAGPVTIPALGTITRPITIGQDAIFELMQMSVVATSMVFDINIRDVTKNESIVDGFRGTDFPIPASLILGSNNFPFRFHEPRMFDVGSKLEVTLVDRSAAPNTVHLCLSGSSKANRMYRI